MRALLSVYDKSGVVDLARGLNELGWELVSSGGTASAIAEAGLPVTKVSDVTGYPEMLGHRVVTLHPAIHGGILADRDVPEHHRDLEANNIDLIDLVVSNLYPFGSNPSVEMIDIGGPAMVRAAAKNHAHVGIVVDPSDYAVVLDELRSKGNLDMATKRALARKAFAHTAAYDAAIVGWLDADELLPPTLHLALERTEDALRYGENPHQKAALYRPMTGSTSLSGGSTWWDEAVLRNGIPLSYLNIYDADAAMQLVYDLANVRDDPAVVIVKHANPCGVAISGDLATAYQLALECDERSAFGGVVALNRQVDESTAEKMVAAPQADVIVAPSYAPGVVEMLAKRRKNTRVLESPRPESPPLHLRQLAGGFLAQESVHFASGRDQWRVVTKAAPTEAQWRDTELAWRICGHVRSNAIVLVHNGQAVGIGAGQQNRVESGEIAAKKAAGRAIGGACASDAFYPFPDGVEAAAAAGVAVVIQPGGSVRDDEVTATADELGLAMVFTGERHFLH
ncbi:MAG: bifunctional phosphoribosylaminoimidazolecarboxamide formyltransferase/IMP cyclohydrolase [Acidimicrobiales bacterium]